MSEFKFACPVCGQHITADSTSGGTRIDCPTCFQKIVVPQAPASGDSKLILSASKADRSRPASLESGSGLGPLRRSGSTASWIATVLLILALGGVGVVAYAYRAQLLGLLHLHQPAAADSATNTTASAAHNSRYAVPTNTAWTLDLAKAVLPDSPAAGRIHGNGFFCERATLTGGTLSLRQGQGWPPELSISVVLPAQRGEYLSGKSLVLAPAANLKVPRLVLRWRDDQNRGQKQDVTTGYAMKLLFGQAASGRMTGRIFLSLPDDTQSFVAGTFDAEIKAPQQTGK